MLNHLSPLVTFVFILTTIITVLLFYKAAHNSNPVLITITAWLVLQSFIGLSGFYLVTDSIPPRFALLVALPVLFIAALFITKKGKTFIDGLDLKILTLLHFVRIPVELVLYWLFLDQAVPELMTFEGRNFDILSGLTAPLVYYFGFVKRRLGKNFLLIWNLICLGLLLNIVINAVLSAPFPFQQFAFEQPNIAVLYFPFVWLPCCIVPIVLFAHLAAIRRITASGFEK